MLYVTFDSRSWLFAGNPSKIKDDPIHASFKIINEALTSGRLMGCVPESVFTLEGLSGKDFRANSGLLESRIGKNTEIPWDNAACKAYLDDALDLGFKLMHCYRIPGLTNPDIDAECYIPSLNPLPDLADQFWEVERKMEAAGAGIAWIKSIGQTYARPEEHWLKGLAKAPPTQNFAISEAVTEWANGDTIAAHLAYQNQYICTSILPEEAKPNSVFSEQNRLWLEHDHGVRFTSSAELGEILQKV